MRLELIPLISVGVEEHVNAAAVAVAEKGKVMPMERKRTLSAEQALILSALDEETPRAAVEVRAATKIKARQIGPHLLNLQAHILVRVEGTRLVKDRNGQRLVVSTWIRTAGGSAALRRWQRAGQIAAAVERRAVAS